jgi:hypothetical protein
MFVQGKDLILLLQLIFIFSSNKFVHLNYDEVGVPLWNSTLSKNAKITRPSITRLRYFTKKRRQNSLPFDHSNLDGSSFSRNRGDF